MQLTTNTRSFIEAEQYSSFILYTLKDGLLGEQFYRNVSEFRQGDTFNIKTVGTVTLQEAAENEDLEYNPIETGNITFQISEYEGDAWFITDDVREEAAQFAALENARAVESTRAFQESMESKFFIACDNVHADKTSAQIINGQPHRISADPSVDDGAFKIGGLNQLRLSFDKANVPHEGRVFICDPTIETVLNESVTFTSDMTSFAQDTIREGLARGMRLVTNIYGFSVILSNRLPESNNVAVAHGSGTRQVVNGVVNVAMCILDDNCKPVMFAERRKPSVEGARDAGRSRDTYVAKAKYGFGTQRQDTFAAYITNRAVQASY